MTTDIFNPNTASTEELRNERARRAVRAFRAMQPGLTGYARAITGRKDISVELDSGATRTDGKKIFFCPPIELGDYTPHERNLCEQRDRDSLKHLCPACRTRETVLIQIYHEIAHNLYGTFNEPTDRAKAEAMQRAIEEAPSRFGEKIKQAWDKIPERNKRDYINLSALISPFLPTLVNALEDIRIDERMFEARKGTRVMFRALTEGIFREGIDMKDGTKVSWASRPLNSQIVIGVFVLGCGYKYDGWFSPEVEAALGDAELNEMVVRARSHRSAAESYALSFPILARLRQLGFCRLPEEEPEDDEMQAPQIPQDSNESGDSEQEQDNDEGNDAGDGNDSSSDHGEDGPEDGDAGDGSDDEDRGGSDQEGGEADADSSDGSGDPQHDQGAQDGSRGSQEHGDASGRESDDAEDRDDQGGDEAHSDSASDGAGRSEREASDRQDDQGRADKNGSAEEDQHVRDDRGDAGPDAEQGSADGPGGDEASQDSDAGRRGASDAAGDRDGESADDADREDRGSDGVGESDDEGLSDAEPFDSGADEGKGGTQLKGDFNYGSPEDAAKDFEVFSGHDHGASQTVESEPMSSADEGAVKVAIMQGEYFEKPSTNVKGVRVHEWGKPIYEGGYNVSDGWSDPSADGDSVRLRRRRGTDADMDVPESVLGPALLEMRRVLSDNARAKTENHLRSGKINKRVLGKRAWSGDDRLFAKKRLPGKRSYAVILGIDISGSTHGVNIALAKRAAMAQAELCNRLGIDFAIYAHTAAPDYTSTSWSYGNGLYVDVYEVKGFDAPWNPTAKNALGALNASSENLDGHTVEFYRKAIEKHPATDKIILYYTDGKMPAANHDEELEILQREITVCKRKNIALLGVGIRTDSPRRHGLDTVEVEQDSDVSKVVRHLQSALLHNR